MNKIQSIIVLVSASWFVSAQADDYFYATEKSAYENLGKFAYFDVNQDLSQEYLHCRVGSDCLLRTLKQLPDQSITNNTSIESSSVFQIYFGFNESKLSDDAIDTLTVNLNFIKAFKSIQLRGWTDPVGGKLSKRNQMLAKSRAEAVASFIKNQGIDVPISILYQPPCCNSDGTSKSPESIRKDMRVVG